MFKPQVFIFDFVMVDLVFLLMLKLDASDPRLSERPKSFRHQQTFHAAGEPEDR